MIKSEVSPSPQGGIRVAVAGDSTLIRNPHFGRAEYFDIFDVTADPPQLVERRFTKPFCGPEAGDQWLPDAAVSLVADCVAVIAGQIGPCPRQELAKLGVLPVEHVGPRLGGASHILAVLRQQAIRPTSPKETPR